MSDRVRPAAVLLKGVLLAIAFEYALVSMPPRFAALNLFAALNMKRQRFPFSARPPVDDSLDVGNLEAMFASHVVSDPKTRDEFRVMVLGDSASWGTELPQESSMPAQLDHLGLTCGGKIVRVYNLSFPRASAAKDLMILDRALAFQPDMFIWMITWFTLSPQTRVDHNIVRQNPDEFQKLARAFDFLPKDYEPPSPLSELLMRNGALFRVARYQFYIPIQLSTGLDQMEAPPTNEEPPPLGADPSFQGVKSPTLRDRQVSLDQVQDFYKLAGSIPVVLVNEPMQVLSGVPNSDIRYNNYYPRWVYDQYRQYLGQAATQNHWNYLDLWKVFPPEYFGDTPLHLIPKAHHLLAKILAPAIQNYCR